MKKAVSLLLSTVIIIACALLCSSCGDNNANVSDPSSDIGSSQKAYGKYVFAVRSNPQVSLSCGTNDTVLYVNFDNDDARTAYADMDWVGKQQSDCLKEMIAAAKQGGYLKDGGTVTLQIRDCTDEQLIADKLAAAKETVSDAAKAENLNVTVQTEEGGNTSPATSSSETGNASSAGNTPAFTENDIYGTYNYYILNDTELKIFTVAINEETFEYSYTVCTPYDPSQDFQEDLQYAKIINGVSYIGRYGDGCFMILTKLTKDSLTAKDEEGQANYTHKFTYDPAKRSLTFTQIDQDGLSSDFLNIALVKE